jgi:hypothetical protein
MNLAEPLALRGIDLRGIDLRGIDLRGIMRAIRHIASEQLVGPESRCIGISTTCYPVATAPGTDLLIAAPHELFLLVNQQHAMDKGNLAVIACAGKTEQG